jgi:hypothetical protein
VRSSLANHHRVDPVSTSHLEQLLLHMPHCKQKVPCLGIVEFGRPLHVPLRVYHQVACRSIREVVVMVMVVV